MAGLSKLAKPFRSTLSDFAKKHKMDAMPGKQWEAYIKANAPKDAKKEAEASGLYQMLNKYEGKKVTKDEIDQHLKKKLPKIKTKKIEASPKVSRKDIVDSAAYEDPLTLDGDRYTIESTPFGYSLLDSNGDVVRNERSSLDLADYINDMYSRPSQYESYTLPGGKDYKETLIQLQREIPDELPEGWSVRELERNGKKYYQAETPSTLGTEWYAPEMADKELRRYFANKMKGEDYLSSHFTDEPNILAHIRTKQRELPTGEGVHFLEEVQSDWGQGLRAGKKLPTAPYVTDTEDWSKLALKKAIEEAAEGGQDYLAWTTGPQQAQRYQLSKAISSLNYDPASKVLRGYDPTGEIAIREVVEQAELPKWIGEPVTQKLLANRAGEGAPYYLRGLDLDIGGEGMKSYYDQILPNTANNLMKQLGLPERVQMIDIPEIGQQPGIRITPALRQKVEEGLPYFSMGAAPLATDEELPAYGKGGEVDVDDEQYEFIDQPAVTIEPRASFDEGRTGKVKQRSYSLGADVNLLDKYGIGADMYGYDVKTPEGRFKDTGIADLRARYTTDEGVTYGAGYSPENRGYRLSRTNRDGDTLSLERTPERPTMEGPGQVIPGEDETTWLRYQKNFAKGGEVDYDAQYEFI